MRQDAVKMQVVVSDNYSKASGSNMDVNGFAEWLNICSIGPKCCGTCRKAYAVAAAGYVVFSGGRWIPASPELADSVVWFDPDSGEAHVL